jgi:hypothetical protein
MSGGGLLLSRDGRLSLRSPRAWGAKFRNSVGQFTFLNATWCIFTSSSQLPKTSEISLPSAPKRVLFLYTDSTVSFLRTHLKWPNEKLPSEKAWPAFYTSPWYVFYTRLLCWCFLGCRPKEGSLWPLPVEMYVKKEQDQRNESKVHWRRNTKHRSETTIGENLQTVGQ